MTYPSSPKIAIKQCGQAALNALRFEQDDNLNQSLYNMIVIACNEYCTTSTIGIEDFILEYLSDKDGGFVKFLEIVKAWDTHWNTDDTDYMYS